MTYIAKVFKAGDELTSADLNTMNQQIQKLSDSEVDDTLLQTIEDNKQGLAEVKSTLDTVNQSVANITEQITNLSKEDTTHNEEISSVRSYLDASNATVEDLVNIVVSLIRPEDITIPEMSITSENITLVENSSTPLGVKFTSNNIQKFAMEIQAVGCTLADYGQTKVVNDGQLLHDESWVHLFNNKLENTKIVVTDKNATVTIKYSKDTELTTPTVKVINITIKK